MLALAEAKAMGLTRLIGVSNFPIALLERAVSCSGGRARHQPGRDASVPAEPKGAGVLSKAWRGRDRLYAARQGPCRGDPVLKQIGAAHGASENQVSLAWLMQQGVIVIPASGSRKHLESNFAASEIRLSDAEMAAIAQLDRGERIINPSGFSGVGLGVRLAPRFRPNRCELVD